jgi:cell division protein FtsB
MTPTQFPRRWVITGLCVFLLALGLLIVSGERGILHFWRLMEDKRKLEAANFLLLQENDGLRRKIQRLRHDDLYLEKVAREELGLARPGEIIYRFAPAQSRAGAQSISGDSPERLRSSARKGRP